MLRNSNSASCFELIFLICSDAEKERSEGSTPVRLGISMMINRAWSDVIGVFLTNYLFSLFQVWRLRHPPTQSLTRCVPNDVLPMVGMLSSSEHVDGPRRFRSCLVCTRACL